MSQRLNLRLFARLSNKAGSGGYTLTPAILLVMGLVVGSLGVVAISNWSSLSALVAGMKPRDAAEMGADKIIAYWSDNPQNRQLLVAGTTPPSAWTTTNANLQSPCVSSTSSRPGTTGFPTSLAVDLKDGQFRNLDDMTSVNTGNQRFRLVAVRYSAGPTTGTAAQVTNRRSIYNTYTLNSSWALGSTSANVPANTNFNQLINLDDPDGGGTLLAGNNTGFISITVEGRVYRPDGTFTTYTTTKEYEILPKCCGGGLGGNNSSSLGSDTRFCGVEFGMVVGINGGRFFSQASNDRYTMRNTANQVVNLASIVGVVANPTDNWQRDAIGPATQVPQLGCRTVPGPCTTTNNSGNLFNNDRVPGDNIMIGQYLNPLGQAGGPCWPGVVSTNYGDVNSVAGRSASCVPFAPLYFPTGLPSIASRYTYTWTPGGNPAIVSQQAVNSDNIPTSYNGYPSFVINGTSAAGDDTVRIWLRANNSNQLAAATGNPTGLTPYLEYCNTKYLPSNNCASVFQSGGSLIHSWALVSRGGAVDTSRGDGLAIGDDFANAVAQSPTTFSGYATGSTPRWPSLWTESDQDQGGGTTSLTAGDLTVEARSGIGNAVVFRDVGTDQGVTVTNYPAIARAVNLYALRNPVLEFSFTRTRGSSAANTSALRLDYSFTSPITTDAAVNTDTGWVSLASVTADGGVRTQAGTTTGTTNVAFNGALSNGAINLSGGAGGSCSIASTTAPYSVSDPLYTCRIQLPPEATAATNRYSHWVKFRLRANSDLGPTSTVTNIQEIVMPRLQIKSFNASTSAIDPPTYLNWCEYSSGFPITANFTGGFHCLGPTIDMRAVNGSNVSSNRFFIDTSDASVTFYYNRTEDTRGIRNFLPAAGTTTGVAGPLMVLTNGASLANVICPTPPSNTAYTGRANSSTTAPAENCTSNVPENVFNPVGEYDRFNVFGRDTTPANICLEFDVANRPCMQVIAIGADSSTTSAAGRARIAGAWIYMPWGLVGFRVNGCNTIPSLADSAYYVDDSWNYGGRLWVRSVYACGQNHFRVPPSSSASLSALVGSNNSADIQYVGWTGVDWVARSTSGAQIGSLN
jgi:hypothetical protein